MVEVLGESDPRPEVPYTSLVDVMARVGYEYEMETTHQDPKGNLHFKRHMGEKFFPHFHAVYRPKSDRFNVHIDIRIHKWEGASVELSEEVQRLRGQFGILSQSKNTDIARFAKDLQKKTTDQAFFDVSRYIRTKKRGKHNSTATGEQKRIKLTRARKRRYKDLKYRRVEEEEIETWYISDWEPIDLKSHEEANRQADTQTDKID